MNSHPETRVRFTTAVAASRAFHYGQMEENYFVYI